MFSDPSPLDQCSLSCSYTGLLAVPEPNTLAPQGLGTGCSLCLENSALGFFHDSLPNVLQLSLEAFCDSPIQNGKTRTQHSILLSCLLFSRALLTIDTSYNLLVYFCENMFVKILQKECKLCGSVTFVLFACMPSAAGRSTWRIGH